MKLSLLILVCSLFISFGIKAQCLPAGLIVSWSEPISSIPSGWIICDGTNGTPDLRDRFIKGAPLSTDPGGIGGAATHDHSGNTSSSSLTTGASGTSGCGVGGASCSWNASPQSHTHNYTHTHNIEPASNNPPFFEVIYLMLETPSATIPDGLIVSWTGLLTDIPNGWVLCDGNGGTVDLQDRFVKGAADGIDPGATGGSLNHTHTIATDNTNFSSLFSQNFTTSCGGGTCGTWGGNSPGQGHNHTYDHDHTIPNASNPPPPFYEVAFLMSSSATDYPNGIIAQWNDMLTSIPNGWIVCDGTNSTPDLTERYLKGAPAGVDPGTTGGAISTHDHGVATSIDPGGTSSTNVALSNGPPGSSQSMQIHNHSVPSHSHTISSDSLEPEFHNVIYLIHVGGEIAISTSQTNVSCYGNADGTANVSIITGTPGYSYSWSPTGGNLATASGLSAGTYIVTLTDTNFCTTTDSVAITQPDSLSLSSINIDASCFGFSDGSIDLNVIGGVGVYSFDWDLDGIGDFDDSEDISGLSAGNYLVNVLDSNGCSKTLNVSVGEPNPIDVSVTQTGSILNANNSNMIYQWIDCKDLSSISGAVDQNYSAPENGSYAVIISDGSCEDTSACYIVDDIGIVNEMFDVTIYPNPTNGNIHINMQGSKMENIKIYDYNGRLIFETNPAKNEIVLDLTNYETQIYFLHIRTENGLLIRKIERNN